MKIDKAAVFLFLAILSVAVAIVVGLLIFGGKLGRNYWFASIFAVAAAGTFLAQKNIADSQKQIDARRKAREDKKNREKNRYI